MYYKCRPGELSRYSGPLRAGMSGDRIPVGARFFAPVQTVPVAHPAFYTMSTVSFPGVKRPGRDVEHPPPHLAPRLNKEHSYRSTPSLDLLGLPLYSGNAKKVQNSLGRRDGKLFCDYQGNPNILICLQVRRPVVSYIRLKRFF